MKKFCLLLFLFIFPVIVFISSCDDAGVSYWPPSGQVTLSLRNFKSIDPNVDGIYEAWLKLDSLGVFIYYSLGRFNISPGGSVVDPGGGQKTFILNGDTSKLYLSSSAFITVEPPGDFDPFPSSRILISTQLLVSQDNITGNMTIGDREALDSAGRKLMEGRPWPYIFSTPTDYNANCFRGIWFCDSNGNSIMEAGLTLNPNSPWTYEAWVADTSEPGNPIYYSMGKFKNPYSPDSDGAGLCKGPNPPYQKPGQDWVLSGCPPGKPGIVNLKNGWYQVYITLEPQNEMPGTTAYDTPFPLRLLKTNYIHPLALCRTTDWTTYVHHLEPYPTAQLTITYRAY